MGAQAQKTDKPFLSDVKTLRARARKHDGGTHHGADKRARQEPRRRRRVCTLRVPRRHLLDQTPKPKIESNF